MTLKYERTGDKFKFDINEIIKKKGMSRIELIDKQINILYLAINNLIKLKIKEDEKIPNIPMRKKASPEEIYESGRRFGLYQANKQTEKVLEWKKRYNLTEEDLK